MAETPQKRPRDDSSFELNDSSLNSKRQKPYNNVLDNLLDEEVEPSHEPSLELSQDLSVIFTTLEQELSSDDSTSTTTTFDFDSPPCMAAEEAELSAGGGEEDEGVKSVMRHLLEASDDELGIPNGGDDVNRISYGENFELFNFSDNGLWEFEDETANYYTVLQSELFM